MSRSGALPDQPFIAEVRLFSGDRPPDGWLACAGGELPIVEHQALFFMLGWRFGGDQWTTFGLPDLRSEDPPHLVSAIAIDGVIAPTGERTDD